MIPIQTVLTEFISWEKTPFHHQGRKKGVGADCAGCIIGCMKELGIYTADVPINYAPSPDGKSLISFLENYKLVQRCEDGIPFEGSIGVFWIRRPEKPQHFGIFINGLNGGLDIVMADNANGVTRVPFDERWQERLNSVWKMTFAEYSV